MTLKTSLLKVSLNVAELCLERQEIVANHILEWSRRRHRTR